MPGEGTFAIRAERPGDVDAIRAVTVAAFRDAPHTSHTEQLIVEQLRLAGQLVVSLVAIAVNDLIGHVALSPVSLSDGTTGWLGLGPVSVRPEWQRRGAGSCLVHEALRLAQDRGAAGCVVLGDPAFYARFGFVADSGLILPGVPPAYFQALGFGAVRPRGTVAYAAAFSA